MSTTDEVRVIINDDKRFVLVHIPNYAASFYRSPAVRGVAGLLGRRTVMRLAGAVPDRLKRPLRRMMFESKADRFGEISAADRVTGFIRDVFARDIALYGAGSA